MLAHEVSLYITQATLEVVIVVSREINQRCVSLLRLSTVSFSIMFLFTSMFTPVSVSAATASFYGKQFHNKRTTSGERFNMNAMTCASNSHKMGTKLRVTNRANGKSVVVKVNDRGGFGKYGRTLDLSKGAFSKIADVKQGLAKVDIKIIK